MSTETILVTGAAGFTGRYFIAGATQAGHRCIALCREAAEQVPEAEHNVTCDLLDKARLLEIIDTHQPSMVVHLAAISFVAHEDTAEIYRVNLLGTLNLLDAISALAPAVSRVLIASSANVYGNAAQLPISEAIAPEPVNHYGVSKYAMEMAARTYDKLPIVLVRPFNYTGVGQSDHFLIPKIVGAFGRREPSIELGNLDVARDFSDVRDVTHAYLKLLFCSSPHGLFNICSGVPIELRSIIAILNDLAGYEIDVRTNSRYVRANEIKVLFGSSRLIDNTIGNYRLHDISSTLEWMYRDTLRTH